MGKNEEKKIPWSYSKVCSRFAERTTMHGIPYVYVSKKTSTKIFWVMVFIVGLALMIYHLFILISTYLLFPTKTSVTLGYDNLQFPAVTLCNVNPMRQSELNKADSYLRDLLNTIDPTVIVDTYYKEENTTASNTTRKRRSLEDMFVQTLNLDDPEMLSRRKRYLDKLNVTTSNRYDWEAQVDQAYETDSWEAKGQKDAYEQAISEVISFWNNEDRATRISIGHQIQSMLIKCSFAGRSCSADNFTLSTHATYGNCYTLQSPYFRSRRSGPGFGLELVLFLQNHDYVKGVANGYGIQVMVHDKDVFPDPYEDGAAISSNAETSMGLFLTRISRMDPPYGNCQKTAAFTKKYGITYTRTVCQKVCEAIALMDTCNCSNSFTEEINLKIFKTRDELGICQTEADLKCYFGVQKKYEMSPKLCACTDPCNENKYTKAISSRLWPSPSYARLLLRYLCNTHGETACKTYEVASDRQLSQNFLKLNIYYEDLNYQNITEVPDYEDVQFVSDVGGTVGLWIGLSILSIVEVFQFFGELVYYVCCKKQK